MSETASSAASNLIEAKALALLAAQEAWDDLRGILSELSAGVKREILQAMIEELREASGAAAPYDDAASPAAGESIKKREGMPPFGTLPTLIRTEIGKTSGDFTLPEILSEIRKTYPNTPRNSMHKYFYQFVDERLIEVVRPGVQGDNQHPAIYRRVAPPSPLAPPPA